MTGQWIRLRNRRLTAALAIFTCLTLSGQTPAPQRGVAPEPTVPPAAYILGPNDQVTLWVLGVAELSDKPFRVDTSGDIDIPLLGRVRAIGRSAADLKAELTRRLRVYLMEPEVTVRITDFKSRPVSVIGAVNLPGVHQLEGGRSLIEVLSLAGGIRPDAGNEIKITRRLEWGRIPLPSAVDDPKAPFSVACVKVKSLLEAKDPGENIPIWPYDVIAVTKAETVYVLGEVTKPGGFVLNERESASVLQALSMAGGITRMGRAQGAKLLRVRPGSGERTEIAVDLKRVIEGKVKDPMMQADDVLYVPHHTAKAVGLRSLEAALGIGTGVIVWRR